MTHSSPWPIFTTTVGQVTCLTLLLAYFFGYPKSAEPLGTGPGITADLEQLFVLPLGFLYTWLIINTGANPHDVFRLSNGLGRVIGGVLEQLGKVSYGVYMYHVIVIYFASFLFTKVALYDVSLPLYFASYFALVAIGLAALAFVSYTVMERRLITMGRRLNVPRPENRTQLAPDSNYTSS